MSIGKMKSEEQIQNIIFEFGYKLLFAYMKGRKRKIVIVNSEGYKADIFLDNIIMRKSMNPSFFEKSNPYSLENIKLWLLLNNKNFKLCDNNVYAGNSKKLDFYCFKCKDIFKMNWDCVLRGCKCSLCDGKQVGKYNNLQYLEPELSKEWLESKHNKTPKNVTIASNEYVHWKCKNCEHEWWTVVSSRTGKNKTGCPKCAEEQKESKIATDCKKYFSNKYNATPEYKLFKNPKTNQWLKCDIYIPDNVFVEIHGHQHHIYSRYFFKSMEDFTYRQNIDMIKKEYCQENGLYIEVDLRKIKTTEEAIEYIENFLSNMK